MDRTKETFVKVIVPVILGILMISLLVGCSGGGGGGGGGCGGNGGCAGTGCTWTGATCGLCPLAPCCDVGNSVEEGMNSLASSGFLQKVGIGVAALIILMFVFSMFKRQNIKANYRAAKYEAKLNEKLMMAGGQAQNLNKLPGEDYLQKNRMRKFDS